MAVQRPRSAWHSLERRLPLAITALVLGTVVVGILAAYHEVRSAAVSLASERMEQASKRLADVVDANNDNTQRSLARLGENPAVMAALNGESVDSAAIDAVLAPLAQSASGSSVMQLRAADGREVATAGSFVAHWNATTRDSDRSCTQPAALGHDGSGRRLHPRAL